MRVLILHRVPYQRIEYARGIDHVEHDVTYLGVQDILSTLPTDLRCKRIERSGKASAYEEAKDWIEQHGEQFDRVISLSEYELIDAARLRERLNVPGAKTDEVQLVRDKVQMKRAISQAGLRVPRFLSLTDLLTSRSAPWPGTTVLKPLNGASSEDVMLFESPEHLQTAIGERSTQIASLDKGDAAHSNFEAEEFISGAIVHFDGLVANSELITITASRYVGTCLAYAQGRPLGSYHFPIDAEMKHWVSRALAAVNLRQGTFHLEAIENDGLVFLEVGNRVGGANVVPTFEMATGVHLPSEELSIALSGCPSRPLASSQTSHAWHGWFVFPGHLVGGSTYRPIPGIERFRQSSSVVRWTELAPGASLMSRITYSSNEAPLTGIVAHDRWEHTRDWLEALFHATDNMSMTRPALH
jgi:hypothetical protein